MAPPPPAPIADPQAARAVAERLAALIRDYDLASAALLERHRTLLDPLLHGQAQVLAEAVEGYDYERALGILTGVLADTALGAPAGTGQPPRERT